MKNRIALNVFMFLLFFLSSVSIDAQNPTAIKMEGKMNAQGSPEACADQTAGQVTFSNFVGKSNDIWGDAGVDTIFLCGDIGSAGDQFDLMISGQDLTGDPDMSTTPGVGYALYTDKPLIGGPNMFNVIQDPHYINGADILVSTGCDVSGSQTFKNTGNLQANLAAGNAVCIWFAPITYDKLDPPSPTNCRAVYEGGTCVKVSVDEAFPVVYLNAIQAANIQNSISGYGCEGSFVVKGGLPDYDSNATYTIEIAKVSDPSKKAILAKSTYHADKTVKFDVGEGGIYGIRISDGKSCDFYTTVDMPGCSTVEMDMPDTTGAKNDVICVPLTVRDFKNITALGFSINWDPSVVAFDKLMTPTNLLGLAGNLINPGFLMINGFDPAGVDLDDGDVVMVICFKLIGPFGASTPIWIGTSTNGNGVNIGDVNGNRLGLGYGSKEGQITILNPNAMNIILDSVNVDCKGAATGEFSATVSGGAGFPVTLDWQETSGAPSGTETINADGQTATVTGLVAGTYELHFVDGVGGVLDTTITIKEGLDLGVGLGLKVKPLCYGDTMSICPEVSIDGSIVANLVGYTFSWNNGSHLQCQDTTQSGFFAVTVTEPTGCTASASQQITQKKEIQLNPIVTNPSCKGVNNGQIEITPSGGTPVKPQNNYDFKWDNGATTTSTSTLRPNLGEKKYYITVTDDNGCEVSDSFDLTYQKVINLAATGQDIGCFGSDDGKIFAEASHVGGTQALPYTYTWNPVVTATTMPTVDSVIASSLAPGMYEITVTDGDGCVDSTSVTLGEPDSMNIVLDSIRHESCNAPGKDGFISISVSGGAGGYTYDWGGGLATPTINGLSPANYTVVVTDANGCTKSATYTVLPFKYPVITNMAKVDVNCQGDTNGSLMPTVTNGNGNMLFYSWSNNGVTTANNTNLGVGTYTLNVTDEYGCMASVTDTIQATQGFFIKTTTYVKPTCPGGSDGRIILEVVNPTNAAETFDFAWDYDNTNHTSVLFNIPAGTYNVTVTGNTSSCPPVTATFTLLDTASIVTDITLLQGVSCFDGSALDGSANVTATYSDGSSGTFNFDWPGSSCLAAVSCTATNLGIGENIVVVSNGVCNVQDTVFVPAPDSIKVTTAITKASCFGYSDGSITAIANGGTGNTYNYGWTPTNQSGTDLVNVSAGNYDLVVTDGVGCSEVFHMVIDEPDSLELLLDLTKTVDVYCFGDSTGQIYVQPVGGNPSTGYTYSWTPNISDSNVASLLSAGTYSVTVSDGKGCTQELTHVLSENPPISATLDPILEPECFGYQTIISIDTALGGSGGPYTFSVDFSPPKSISLDFPVFAGDHSIRVFDIYECKTELDVTIGEPDEIFVDLPPIITVDLGDSVQLNPVISSSLPIDSFYWTPLSYLMPDSVLNPQVVGLTHDQNYSLVVVDANGCSAEASTVVEVDRNRNVYIPNIFSPNNDGFNDVFFPKTGIGVKQVNFMTVYDRWGEIVYEARDFLPRDNSSESWNGMFRGRALNPGVYIYLIEVEFIDGVKLLYRGDITLLR